MTTIHVLYRVTIDSASEKALPDQGRGTGGCGLSERKIILVYVNVVKKESLGRCSRRRLQSKKSLGGSLLHRLHLSTIS